MKWKQSIPSKLPLFYPPASLQQTLHELANRHAAELKKVRRKLKASSSEVAVLTDEITDLRFRSHELEAVAVGAGGAGAATAALLLRGMKGAGLNPSDVLAPRDVAALAAAGAGSGGASGGSAGAGAAGSGAAKAGVGAGVLADMAALKQRQQDFLSAAAGGGGSMGPGR